MTIKNKAIRQIKTWRENPSQFVIDNFGVEPDKWQHQVLQALPSQDKNKLRISMQACVGPGKSAVLAWCGWNFLSCYAERGEHPKGAAVSITFDNLKDNLWSEFSKWRSRSEFLMRCFEWSQSRISSKDHPETWFISARSWPKTADSEEQGRVLSGLHSKFVLYLIDESGDIPPPVLRAAEQGLSNCVWGKILQAGNPTSHEGMLYLAASQQSDIWFIVRITSDPDDPDRTPRVDMDWARKQIKQYGRDNPWVMASILGQFPPSSINTLLSPDEVASAMRRKPREEEYLHAQKRIGCDVARFGLDSTVFFPRQGLLSYPPEEMRGARTNEIAARLMMMKETFGSELEFVDDTGGWGAGVIDSCLQAGITVVPVNYSGQATDARYFNKRSEIWFNMANWVKRGGVLPPELTEIVQELSCPTYTFQNGKFRLEEKEQVKNRLGFSPDRADALAQTFAYQELPSNMGDLYKGEFKSNYDPFQ